MTTTIGGNGEHSGIVTTEHCKAHLTFLATLAELRHSITTVDGLFGIDEPNVRISTAEEEEDLRLRVEEKVWQVYVSRAVDRFEQWWSSLSRHGNPPTVMSLKRFELNPLTLDETLPVFKGQGDLPPLGRSPPIYTWLRNDLWLSLVFHRRTHGLAFFHAQPPFLSRRLHQTGQNATMGYGLSMGPRVAMHHHKSRETVSI